MKKNKAKPRYVDFVVSVDPICGDIVERHYLEGGDKTHEDNSRKKDIR